VVQLGAIAEYVGKRPGDTLVNQPTKFDSASISLFSGIPSSSLPTLLIQ